MIKKMTLIIFALMLLFQASAFAAQNKTAEVEINKVKVRVNNVQVASNNLLYNNTTYLTIRAVAEMLKLPVNFYKETKTVYIGKVPEGEVPEKVLSTWSMTAPAKSNVELEKPRKAKISFVLNEVSIKVNGKKISSDNIIYKGSTYAPMRAVAQMLGYDVKVHVPTSTVYIGEVPANLSFDNPKPASNNSSKMYDVAATGSMKGWRLLKGHEYEGKLEIYYKLNGTIVSTQVKDIQKVDLKKKVSWVDDSGKKRQNTVGEIYKMFGTFSEYTSEWFYEKFGDLYADWLLSSTADVSSLVDRYLEETGQLDAPGSNITLGPDSVFE
ncbi:stalk domain-containing protein [Paenibacillus sp. FJAT-27812]|uniref:stalk domain-containing protein n=1 Tax=Paenibacillus sp. FJAT-27812 TaxID=1684143 RepID=UPI0006A7BDE0|nr:stalk domain-containing protein [Paenibacillus sp. FJAT-27812]